MDNKEYSKKLSYSLNLMRETDKGLNGMINFTVKDANIDEDYVELNYLPDDWHRNPYGGVHGGMIAAVFDYGMGVCATVLTGSYKSTVDLNINYLKAMMGDKFVLRTEFMQNGRTMMRCLGKIFDDKGNLCATATATYMHFIPKNLKPL